MEQSDGHAPDCFHPSVAKTIGFCFEWSTFRFYSYVASLLSLLHGTEPPPSSRAFHGMAAVIQAASFVVRQPPFDSALPKAVPNFPSAVVRHAVAVGLSLRGTGLLVDWRAGHHGR